MAYTVQYVVSAVQRLLPDLSQTVILQLINEVEAELVVLIPELSRDESQTVALVAGTQEYALDEAGFQYDSALFTNQAGNAWLGLGSTSVEFLSKQDPTWRGRDGGAGTPWLGLGPTTPESIDFYVTTKNVAGTMTKMIGFNYPPDAATVLGTLKLYQSRRERVSVGINDNLLPNIHSPRPYIEGVLYYGAQEVRPSIASPKQQAYEYQIRLLRMFVRTWNESLKKPQQINIRASVNDYPAVEAGMTTENGVQSQAGGPGQ